MKTKREGEEVRRLWVGGREATQLPDHVIAERRCQSAAEEGGGEEEEEEHAHQAEERGRGEGQRQERCLVEKPAEAAAEQTCNASLKQTNKQEKEKGRHTETPQRRICSVPSQRRTADQIITTSYEQICRV